MKLTFRVMALILAVLFASLHLLAQSGVSSPLLLKTSDPDLQKAFDWAKAQALSYVGPGSDPVGDWYEAALPGRNAFCMRDVSHQTMGAFALGLASQNRNMLLQFAKNISASRDWATYWEIDHNGKPSSADYRSHDDFWYNLPANFDVMTAALRMYQWTGDETYLSDPAFVSFYQHTVSDFPRTWDLNLPSLLTRSRIMNRHLTSGEFVESRGIPSYTEEQHDFVVGVDLLAAEYRAFRLAANLARTSKQNSSANDFDHRAAEMQQLIASSAWDPVNHHFYGFMDSHQKFFGEGDAFVLYFSVIKDPNKIQGALASIEKKIGTSAPNIESQSYYPETLYKYGHAEAAYAQILDLSRSDRERREYPEVSYSIIGAIVTGMMGVDVLPQLQSAKSADSTGRSVIHTQPQLPGKSSWVELDHLPVRNNIIDLIHDGNQSSTLTNASGPALLWKPTFYGRSHFLLVDGKKVPATTTMDGQNRAITTGSMLVPQHAKITVKLTDPDLH